MTTLLILPKIQFTEADGSPAPAGKVFFKEAGTSTPKDTFKDLAGLVPHTNPVILDSNGEETIRLGEGLYKVIFELADGTPRWTVDNVDTLGGQGTFFQVVNNIADLKALDAGSSTIVEVLGYFNPPGTTVSGYTEVADAGGGMFYWDSDSTEVDNGGTVIIPDSTPATGRWIRVFDGPVSVKWFGAVGDYVLDNGSLNGSPTDNTAEFNAALSFARIKELSVRVPKGGYQVSDFLSCGVQMIGDQKPRMDTNLEYGDGTWSSTVDFEGAAIIWDKSTLLTTEVYLRNVSGDDSNGVNFKDIIFLSKSSGGDGGGKLLEAISPATTTKYDFGNLPVFENCYVLNFASGINVEAYRGLNIGAVEFRGCQQVSQLGIITTDLAEQISFNDAVIKKCGDALTDFLKIENAEAVYFNRVLFDTTSAMGIRRLQGVGMHFSQCYYLNQKNSAGVGGGTFEFLLSTAEASALTGKISFHKTQGGKDAGDIDLALAPSIPELTLIDSDLKTDTNGSDILLGNGNLIQLGSVNTGTVTTTGFDNRFTPAKFQYKGIELDFSGSIRQIKLLTTADDEQLSLTPTDSANTTDGSQVLLKANLDAGGAADVDITAGDGSNPGDINLLAGTAKGISLLPSIISDVKMSVLGKGLFVKEGVNATMGTDTLVNGVKVVSTTKVTASSRVFVVHAALNDPPGGTSAIGVLNVISRIAGTSFTVRSTGAGGFAAELGDDSDFVWIIIEPS